jgi:uncharacterized membrane protein YfcA
MPRTENTIISGMTVITSLAFYWYARINDKSEVPYVMIGGFVGSVLGELIAGKIKKNNNHNS